MMRCRAAGSESHQGCVEVDVGGCLLRAGGVAGELVLVAGPRAAGDSLFDPRFDEDGELGRIWASTTSAWRPLPAVAGSSTGLATSRSFTWTSYDFTVTSTIYDVEHRARTLWGGAAQGIVGTHEWLFERTEEGVHVTTSESFAGDPVQADTAGLQALLDSSLTAWLSRMKARAESTD